MPNNRQGNKIRDHEGTAPVFYGLDREAQKMAQPEGTAGHGHDHPHAGTTQLPHVPNLLV